MMNDDINYYIPSVLNPRTVRKPTGDSILLTQNSIVSRCSLSLKRNGASFTSKNRLLNKNKENVQNVSNIPSDAANKLKKTSNDHFGGSIGFSAIEDLVEKLDRNSQRNISSSPLSFIDFYNHESKEGNDPILVSVSSATELNVKPLICSEESTLLIDPDNNKPLISLSFAINNCKQVDVSSSSVNIKKISVCHNNNNECIVECDVREDSDVSFIESESDESMDHQTVHSLKRSTVAVAVDLEIKKKKLTGDNAIENEKVLILNTDAIGQVSHVIVQPPNYNILRRSQRNKLSSPDKKPVTLCNNGKSLQDCKQVTLKQKSIAFYLPKKAVDVLSDNTVLEASSSKHVPQSQNKCVNRDDMSQKSGINSTSSNLVRSPGSLVQRGDGAIHNQRSRSQVSPRPELFSQTARKNSAPVHPNSPKLQKNEAQKRSSIMKTSGSDAHSRITTMSSVHNSGTSTPMVQDMLSFTNPSRKKNKIKSLPDHKIVCGTHFAVDAFCYGDITNVRHYFLSHFHSDHYSGLKRTFNKSLFCSKITADLCVSRLGVNPVYINVMKLDEPIVIDGIEVIAVDANHCPGAIMLLFTLPNGKNILHTGDFRASPAMESYPVFWNKDVHTIYLDTTYCNPRYDFPTQDQSMDMALYLLRQKKTEIEKTGNKFSSVLIVCGTYTIGKEKFFTGLASRVGCSVWACPEKERVLQAVEGRGREGGAGREPAACQLHVVPMRDICLEKLQLYLENQKGAFTELVAFKPSGWENGKNYTLKGGAVTIYGVPYSEHSSFSELVRFVNFLKPKQIIPTVEISGGIKVVQKFFPCPLVYKESRDRSQSKMTSYYKIQNNETVSAITWYMTSQSLQPK